MEKNTEKKNRSYESYLTKNRENYLNRIQQDYEVFQETKTFNYPSWLYGEPKGKLFKVEVEDSPSFGDTAYLEFDSGRTAFLIIDMQTDFCGEQGYVNVMGYNLSLTAAPIKPIKKMLDAVRETDITVIYTREGHEPDLSDAPYNKVLRSKIIGNGVGIGEEPEGGLGRLLVRGEENWDIIDELYPEPGDFVVDKAGKGAFGSSNIHMVLKNLGITHLIIAGITTDVCVHTIMREANDFGYWCMMLKDSVGATDYGNHLAAIKSVKMQGGVFGNVSDSDKVIEALKDAQIK
ncbi:cysteine hydrolase family protein [Enterococcus aquimarinus]|uniref:Nicotinamidase-like amidase n=1 Tax=Enterococcus aquimarinus TaxID=328396 RepID=A0A1L8QTG0_9ENTE|nr:isochorismatase family cysteine hydrolase [Enterococcus aquimarinus]OJG10787.1 nicotinamidase-like amidase [Enterococcus aquimarinus]